MNKIQSDIGHLEIESKERTSQKLEFICKNFDLLFLTNYLMQHCSAVVLNNECNNDVMTAISVGLNKLTF